MDWDLLLKVFKHSYYTEPISAIVGLCSAFICFRFRKESKSTIFLYIHSLSSLIATLFCKAIMPLFYNFHLSKLEVDYIFHAFSIGFTIFEIVCFLGYIKINLPPKKHSTILRVILLILISYIAFYVIQSLPLEESEVSSIYIYESIFFIFVCILYFREIFNQKPEEDFIKIFTILPVSGILLLSICTISVFSISNYFQAVNHQMYDLFYAINYIAYALLFLTYIISILWNHQIIKSKSLY